MGTLTTTQPDGEQIRIRSENGGTVELSVASSAALLAALGFYTVAVTDDSGLVAAGTTVTHVVATAGVAATDHVVGIDIPALAGGSGLVVVPAVSGANAISLTYDNGLLGASTNGNTTYSILMRRF